MKLKKCETSEKENMTTDKIIRQGKFIRKY